MVDLMLLINQVSNEVLDQAEADLAEASEILKTIGGGE